MPPKEITDDPDAFRQIFEAHRDEVYRYLHRLTGNRHDAEDLLQETFVRLWRKRAQFRAEGSLAGYLRRIAYRTYLNARARLDRDRVRTPIERVNPSSGAAGPDEHASEAELERFWRRKLREAVAALPDSWREPFVLFRFEGWSMKEIGDALGISRKAVELRVARALRRIAGMLRELRARQGGSLPRR